MGVKERKGEKLEEVRDKRRSKELARILATVIRSQNREDPKGGRTHKGRGGDRGWTLTDVLTAERGGHWAGDCPRRAQGVPKATPINFGVHTGAVNSVLKAPLGPLSDKRTLVQGASGSQYRAWTMPSFACGSIQIASQHLPLNGKTWKRGFQAS